MAARQSSDPSAAAGGVLLTLAASQFLMALDSSVMNVSMTQVAHDVGTSITGIQTAITLYALVMAAFMVIGGKLGGIIGRRRAFEIGCVVYGVGSLVTGLSTSLPVLILGWSVLEGLGAVLILPAVVALIAVNFAPAQRPSAYGLMAAVGAVAIAVGPLLGGAATTYLSWRWVFFGEVLIVAVILVLSRKIKDTAARSTAPLDVLGAALCATGLGVTVFGVLRSSDWGWLSARPGGPSLLGTSLTFWFIVGGLVTLWCFLLWEKHLAAVGREPLIRISMLQNTVLRSGLTLFGFQFLVQAGVFFVVPLFLSVVLELPALETGLRVLPLSLSLLAAALGIPRLWPHVSPRRAVRVGIALMLVGILLLRSGIDLDAVPAVVAVPMVFMGLGIGALASQLGAVMVSSVDEELSGDVGGLQNTATNLGSSVGTALAGSILIAALSSSFLAGITQNPDVPESVKQAAHVELSTGASFVSDAQLSTALADAGVSPTLQATIVEQNRASRIDGLHVALGVLSLVAVLALFFTGGIPTRQPQDQQPAKGPSDGSGPGGSPPDEPSDESRTEGAGTDEEPAGSEPAGSQSPTARAASNPSP